MPTRVLRILSIQMVAFLAGLPDRWGPHARYGQASADGPVTSGTLFKIAANAPCETWRSSLRIEAKGASEMSFRQHLY